MPDAQCINTLSHEKLLEISDVRTNDDWTLLTGIALQLSTAFPMQKITKFKRV